MRGFFLSLALGLSTSARAEISFMRDIAPMIERRCTGCHGAKKAEGNYRAHTFEFLSEALIPGKPLESDLYLLAIEQDPEFRMPQEDEALSREDIDRLREWIAQGASFDGEDPKASFRSQALPRPHAAPPERYRIPVPILAMAYSSDGRELAIAGHNEISIWDPNTGLILRRLPKLPMKIQSIRWLTEGKQLIVGGGTPGDYGELALVDAMTGYRLTIFDTFEDIVLGAALDTNEEHLAAVSADRSVRAYHLASGTPLWTAQVHSDWATSVAFSPDNQFVISTSRDQTVKVLNAIDGSLFTTYNGHRRNYGKHAGRFKVYAGTFDPHTGLALSAGDGKAIRLWDPVTAKTENGTAGDMEERFFKPGHTRYIPHGSAGSIFALDLDSQHVYLAGSDAVVRAFHMETGEPHHTLTGHRDWIYALCLSPSTDQLATGAHDGEVCIWDTHRGTRLRSFIAAPGFKGHTVTYVPRQ